MVYVQQIVGLWKSSKLEYFGQATSFVVFFVVEWNGVDVVAVKTIDGLAVLGQIDFWYTVRHVQSVVYVNYRLCKGGESFLSDFSNRMSSNPRAP